jgi:hypothetical protein
VSVAGDNGGDPPRSGHLTGNEPASQLGPATPSLPPQEPPTPTDLPESISHVDLIGHARALEHSAFRGDPTAVRHALEDLQRSLIVHTRNENADFDLLAAPAARVVRDGHARLVAQVERLSCAATASDTPCDCVKESLRLVVAIVHQAQLETRLLHKQTPSGTGPSHRNLQ